MFATIDIGSWSRVDVCVPRGIRAFWLIVCSLITLSACGGGGGDSPLSNVNNIKSSGTGYAAGVYMPSGQFKGQCAAPRPGNTNDHPGTALAENLFLRSYTNESYLWYRDVPDVNPAGYSTTTYFDVLKSPLMTPSGHPKDKYHFTYPTAVWEALSQSGTEASYGAEWAILSTSVPRRFVIAYIHPNSPASRLSAPLMRGEVIEQIDGINIDAMQLAQIGDALYPDDVNQSHSFRLRNPYSSGVRTVSITSENVVLASVQNISVITTSTGPVGYMQFNDHLAQSEAALATAIAQFRTASVRDLIIDMRYNGGGYLAIASELGYMIAGPTIIGGQRFELVQYNDKNPNTNPLNGQPITPTPFYSTAQNFSVAGGTPLPTLGLPQVYVLTGPGTCSASESVINGLRGIGVNVIQIGSTTCGKPYGFFGTDNCGTTYFTIQFQTVNAAGFGSYADGFIPQNGSVFAGTPPAAVLPGCSVADDFSHALGDPQEARLAAALNYRSTSTCPAATGMSPPINLKQLLMESGADELRGKSMLRENRWN